MWTTPRLLHSSLDAFLPFFFFLSGRIQASVFHLRRPGLLALNFLPLQSHLDLAAPADGGVRRQLTLCKCCPSRHSGAI